MRLSTRLALALCAALIVVGCATHPEIPYDRSANAVTTIGLLDPGMGPQPDVVLTGTVGQSMAASAGLIGALVGNIADESMRAARVRHFEEGCKQQNYISHDKFIAAMTMALEARGYKVVPVAITRPSKTEAVKTFPKSNDPPVDAYLDIAVIDYGYLAAGIGKQPYRPFVHMTVNFVSASDHKVLMQDTIQYNPLNAPKKVVTIAPDPQFAFENADALYADPQHAVQGLDQAFAQTADALGNLLR